VSSCSLDSEVALYSVNKMPLFPGVALDTAWDDLCEDFIRAVDRLSAIGSQDALILLRSSFSATKVIHLL